MVTKSNPSRWFWALTGANLLICLLLIVFIFLVLTALAHFAAGVAEWPGAVLLGIGLVLSTITGIITRTVPRSSRHSMRYSLNGVALAVYLIVIVGLGTLFLRSTRRLFLLPAGFHGELYVVHGSTKRGAKGIPGFWRLTYQVPPNGVVITDDPMPAGSSMDMYKYVYPDGHQQSLKDAGPGTLPDTPENRLNDKEVVTYNSTFSPSSDVSRCEIEEVSIGTRAFLLGPHPYVTHATDPFNNPHLCRK